MPPDAAVRVPEFYVDGLEDAYPLTGGNYRFTFYEMKAGVIVPAVQLVAHSEAVPSALVLAARRVLGIKLAMRCHSMPLHLH